MKLSQLTTDQVTDILCEITPFVSNIVGDAELMDTLKNKVEPGSSVAEIYLHGSRMISKAVPIVFKDHRHDVFSVLAVLNGTTAEEIANQKFSDTLAQIKEAVSDEDLRSFFRSLQQEGVTE